ncbi:MAG: rubrerythrin [Gammaproteobacteria bacterium]|nr:rubrerythrin [Gammaproteobacteria bacterium]
MSNSNHFNIYSIEEFLAHSLALKCETEDRLQELADCLEEHNNLKVAHIFRELEQLAAESVSSIEQLAKGLELPSIPIWDFQWYCSNSPESACIDNAHYQMNTHQALELAKFNSGRTHRFLRLVIDEIKIDEVQQSAQLLLSHEEIFISRIEQWMEDIGNDETPMCTDLDPPNMPE